MSVKITAEKAKEMIPSNVKGIAIDPYDKKKVMTYGDFLKIPKVIADRLKQKGKKITSCTYWRGFHDEWDGVSTAIDIKFNGKHVYTFIVVSKFTKPGNTKYVIPTKKNCSLLDHF